MKNKKIIVHSSLNYYLLSEKIFDEEWIRYRIDIFMKYTRKSLENQTNQDFLAIIRYHPKTEDFINKILLQYPKLPNNIVFTYDIKETIKNKNFLNDEDELLYVRLDCDDMYKPDYFEILMKYEHKEDTEVIISQNGYIYDIASKRIANYFDESPPFLAYIYNGKEFKEGKSYRHPNGHAGAITLKYELIDGYNYIVIIHGNNTSSKFNKPKHTLKELYGDEYKDVIKKFKLD